MKKKWILLLGLCLIVFKVNSQYFAVKSNMLYDVTTTFNFGVEYAFTDQWTLDVSANFNPWSFPQSEKERSGVIVLEHGAKIKHWLIQPELRWWMCEKFEGHFFGAHFHTGQFNVGGLTFFPNGMADGFTDNEGEFHPDGLQHKRFQGWLLGAGVSYGYHWILTDRFSLEFTLGFGYTYLNYDKYGYQNFDPKEAGRYMHYLGPTKIGITAVIMLK
jgi:long-subunit fatty acid transport protein